MQLSQLGLRPLTLACLHSAGIYSTHTLLNHTCRELIWHREITPTQLYEIIKQLNRCGLMLGANPNCRRPRLPGERNLELFRLRVVEGRTNKETAQQLGISVERVRQILAFYFGLHGEPPAVKHRQRRASNTPASEG